MRGQHIDTLSVYTKNLADKNESIVWTKKGNQGNIWIKGQVNLVVNDSYTMIFEARRGNGYMV